MSSKPYSIIELKQGTSEWLEWRHAGIGASDAPTVMGENPWKDAESLLQEKIGPPTDYGQNAAMAMGTALEPRARQCYVDHRGIEVKPVCIQSTQFEWLRASIDGLSDDGDLVVEIKCGKTAYRKTRASGRVPGYYYGQVQHILAITNLEMLDFWCYLPGRSVTILTVPRDGLYIEQLLETEALFWKRVSSAV